MDLIGPYIKSIRQQQPGGAIINNNVSLACMAMIDPAMGWFEIVGIPTYNIDEVTGPNYEYIDKLSARLSHLFNNTWLIRYLCPRQVVFDNIPEFKRYFTHFLKDFDIKPFLMIIKNPQANSPVERVN